MIWKMSRIRLTRGEMSLFFKVLVWSTKINWRKPWWQWGRDSRRKWSTRSCEMLLLTRTDTSSTTSSQRCSSPDPRTRTNCSQWHRNQLCVISHLRTKRFGLVLLIGLKYFVESIGCFHHQRSVSFEISVFNTLPVSLRWFVAATSENGEYIWKCNITAH